MQTQLKFRVWNGEQMISPDYIDRQGIAHWKENSIHESTDKVMMWTGAIDKNFIEIYEGDILNSKEWNGEYFVVKWGSGHGNHTVGVWRGFYLPFAPWEVIGNIYCKPTIKQ